MSTNIEIRFSINLSNSTELGIIAELRSEGFSPVMLTTDVYGNTHYKVDLTSIKQLNTLTDIFALWGIVKL